MICYTNHALDQFLSSIIRKLPLKPGEIVRVGGRSTHSEIEPYLIQKLRQNRGNDDINKTKISQLHEILGTVKKQMDDCQRNFYESTQRFLTVDQLLLVMDKKHLLTLIEPILPKLKIHHHHWSSSKGGIYCCDRVASSPSTSPHSHLSSDDEESSDDDVDHPSPPADETEPLSPHEWKSRLRNRIHCRKLDDLPDEDQTAINELLCEWLKATPLTRIIAEANQHLQGNDFSTGSRCHSHLSTTNLLNVS